MDTSVIFSTIVLITVLATSIFNLVLIRKCFNKVTEPEFKNSIQLIEKKYTDGYTMYEVLRSDGVNRTYSLEDKEKAFEIYERKKHQYSNSLLVKKTVLEKFEYPDKLNSERSIDPI
jgi:hypothetical protein